MIQKIIHCFFGDMLDGGVKGSVSNVKFWGAVAFVSGLVMKDPTSFFGGMGMMVGKTISSTPLFSAPLNGKAAK